MRRGQAKTKGMKPLGEAEKAPAAPEAFEKDPKVQSPEGISFFRLRGGGENDKQPEKKTVQYGLAFFF